MVLYTKRATGSNLIKKHNNKSTLGLPNTNYSSSVDIDKREKREHIQLGNKTRRCCLNDADILAAESIPSLVRQNNLQYNELTN